MGTNSFTISIQKLKWVRLALSTDSFRDILQSAAIQSVRGATYLAATDTHRLHIVKIADTETVNPTLLLDIKRVLHEAAFAGRGAQFVRFYFDLDGFDILGAAGKDQKVLDICGRKVLTTSDKFPNWERVVPEASQPHDGRPGTLAINVKYLKDAGALAPNGRIHIWGGGSTRPQVIQGHEGPAWGQEWAAIVMPMMPEAAPVTKPAKSSRRAAPNADDHAAAASAIEKAAA